MNHFYGISALMMFLRLSVSDNMQTGRSIIIFRRTGTLAGAAKIQWEWSSSIKMMHIWAPDYVYGGIHNL